MAMGDAKKPIFAVPAAPEPKFVIGQMTRKLDPTAAKFGMDDGKDLIIVFLLMWIAVILAYVIRGSCASLSSGVLIPQLSFIVNIS